MIVHERLDPCNKTRIAIQENSFLILPDAPG